jgi:hypothetical protein
MVLHKSVVDITLVIMVGIDRIGLVKPKLMDTRGKYYKILANIHGNKKALNDQFHDLGHIYEVYLFLQKRVVNNHIVPSLWVIFEHDLLKVDVFFYNRFH